MYKVVTAHTAQGLEKAMNAAAGEGYKAIGTVSVAISVKPYTSGNSIVTTIFTHMMES